MKLRTMGLVGALVLVPGAVRAQVDFPCCRPITRTLVDQMLPLFRAEVTSSAALDSKLGQVAMMKSTYIASKNALMVAKLDATYPARLSALPFDDGSRARRQANVTVYLANKARIDAALIGVRADPTCGLCAPPATGTAATTR